MPALARTVGLLMLPALVAAGAALAQEGGAAPRLPGPAAAAVPRGRAPDVDRALAWLEARQASDGGFGTHDRLALTGMAGLAFLASGSTPCDGPYAEAISFVLERREPSGAFADGSSGYSEIHNHGFALAFLAECHGMSACMYEGAEVRLAEAIRGGIAATVASQEPNGGFGYFLFRDPRRSRFKDMMIEDEASTTISQLQALRAARNAGFAVPADAISRATTYLEACQHATGGFIYSLKLNRVSIYEGKNAAPTFAITAAALACLQALGHYEGPAFERGVAYMRRFQPPAKAGEFWFYGHYYAAQVMHARGGPDGEAWMAAVLAALAERQRADGSFSGGDLTLLPSDDAVLSTAWAAQIGCLERGALPLFAK